MASVEHTQDESQWFKAMFDYATIGIIVTNEKGKSPISIDRRKIFWL